MECLKVYEYICKKFFKFKYNYIWYFIILYRERKKNFDIYICEVYDLV